MLHTTIARKTKSANLSAACKRNGWRWHNGYNHIFLRLANILILLSDNGSIFSDNWSIFSDKCSICSDNCCIFPYNCSIFSDKCSIFSYNCSIFTVNGCFSDICSTFSGNCFLTNAFWPWHLIALKTCDDMLKKILKLILYWMISCHMNTLYLIVANKRWKRCFVRFYSTFNNF